MLKIIIFPYHISVNIRFLIFFAAVSAFFAYLSFRMINGIREVSSILLENFIQKTISDFDLIVSSNHSKTTINSSECLNFAFQSPCFASCFFATLHWI